jgi:hypothetical protein
VDYTPSLGADTQPVRRDYEDYAVGETERHAHAGNKEGGTALVTDETAGSGKHSLKFTDAAGLGQNFFHYVTYPVEHESGRMRMAFDLRWEKGALMALD